MLFPCSSTPSHCASMCPLPKRNKDKNCDLQPSQNHPKSNTENTKKHDCWQKFSTVRHLAHLEQPARAFFIVRHFGKQLFNGTAKLCQVDQMIKKHRDPYGRSRSSLCNEMSGYALYTYILPADDMGVVGHAQKTQLPCHLQSEKNRKCISPVSCVKCLGKNHMTWDLCVQKMQNMSCQLPHTLYYLLAVGKIQNYTSAVRIFQSHMNPFTSLFYLATI